MSLLGSIGGFAKDILGGSTGGVLGNLAGGVLGMMGQREANQSSAQSVQKQMDFQERMSNTSYQRGMSDMKKAGLNPMLAFMKGGASVPTGSTYTSQNELAPLGSSVKEIAPMVAQVENIRANTAKSVADTGKASADTDLSNAMAAKVRAETPNIQAQTEKIGYEIANILEDTHLKYAEVRKVNAEITQLALQGDLTSASTSEALARAGLTRAEIARVKPEIDKILAETINIRAELPSINAEGVIKGTLATAAKGASTSLGGIYDVGEWAGKNRIFDMRHFINPWSNP